MSSSRFLWSPLGSWGRFAATTRDNDELGAQRKMLGSSGETGDVGISHMQRMQRNWHDECHECFLPALQQRRAKCVLYMAKSSEKKTDPPCDTGGANRLSTLLLNRLSIACVACFGSSSVDFCVCFVRHVGRKKMMFAKV